MTRPYHALIQSNAPTKNVVVIQVVGGVGTSKKTTKKSSKQKDNLEMDDSETVKTNQVQATNTQATNTQEVIYIRYDDTNMKYVYLCVHCNTTWRTDNKI